MEEDQNKFEALIKALPDLLFFLSAEGIFLDFHAPDPLALIVPPDRFLGKPVTEILPRDLGGKLETLMSQVLESGQAAALEYPLSISGTVRYFEARLVRFDRVKILAIVRDITDRKELEKALGESEAKYKQLVDCAPTGIWEIDYEKQRILSVNDVMCTYLGYTREEILSRHPLDFLTEDSQRIFGERLRKIMARESVPNLFELDVKNRQGSIVSVLINIREIHEEGRLKGALAVAQDITLRKKAERAVRESEGHLRALMESAENFAVYRLAFDPTNPYGLNVVFVSPSIRELMGIEDPLHFESWFKHIHPDDQARIVAAQLKANQTLHFDESMRIFLPQKGEWRWIRAISSGVLDEKGMINYVNGIITDLTEKKKAEEALQKAHDHLEQRVKERTVQLLSMNEKLKTEIKERKQIEKTVAKSERKLRFLSNQLITAQENERKRIAIELHDELGQSLVGLKFQLSNLTKKLGDNQPGLRLEFEQSIRTIDRMTENVRRLSRDLRPSVLEHLGLFEALQWLFVDCSQKFLLVINHSLTESDLSFSKEQEVIIFRIFQEALTNIGKHARATQVSVTMETKENEVYFSIKDNGKGFDLKVFIESKNPSRGLGLTAMDERARMAGGHLQVKSQKGKGTQITFSVPKKKGRKR